MGGPEPSPDKTMAEIEIVDEDLGAPEDVAAEKAAADDIARLAPPRNRSEKVLAILSLSTGLLLYALDATMVSVAIPRMVAWVDRVKTGCSTSPFTLANFLLSDAS